MFVTHIYTWKIFTDVAVPRVTTPQAASASDGSLFTQPIPYESSPLATLQMRVIHPKYATTSNNFFVLKQQGRIVFDIAPSSASELLLSLAPTGDICAPSFSVDFGHRQIPYSA